MIDRFALARPLLTALSPESAHRLTIAAMRWGLAGTNTLEAYPGLETECFGLRFSNPLGLAAGFDKNAEVPAAGLALGFGFVEFGTVTPRPQAGNPRPRLFRLPEQRAIINRMGFNNEGLDAAVSRLTALRAKSSLGQGWIGGNIGKNKDSTDAVADYAVGARRLSPLVDYLTVNVSSPNTPGLRALQRKAVLVELLTAVQQARSRPIPVLVKIAPDLTEGELAEILEATEESGIAGLIISNTTVSRPDGLPANMAAEAGGLSGAPLFPLATATLRSAYRMSGGRIPLVGVGGISDPDQAYAKIRAGASLLQLYSALVYSGPALIATILSGLAARLRADGFSRLQEAVGADCR